jgi:hypothetical protein
VIEGYFVRARVPRSGLTRSGRPRRRLLLLAARCARLEAALERIEREGTTYVLVLDATDIPASEQEQLSPAAVIAREALDAALSAAGAATDQGDGT